MKEIYEVFDFVVEEEYSEKRLDAYLSMVLSDYSRSYIQKLVEGELVSLKGEVCKVKKTKVALGDRVSIKIPEEVCILPVAEDIPLDIVYEDDDVLVVNKPQGMVVHGGAGNYTGTMVNALLAHTKNLSDLGGEMRPGIVHRIDKDTSGLLVVAKNNNAHEKLSAQLKEHTMDRKYYGIIQGCPKVHEGIIDQPIARNPKDRLKMGVVFGGRNAVTEYRVIEKLSGYALVECILQTGRTHQIRVHMCYIGHPLMGDMLYNGNKSKIKGEGQFLHAKILGFTHPVTGERMIFESELPEYFERALRALRI